MQRELTFSIKVYLSVPKTIVFGTVILFIKNQGLIKLIMYQKTYHNLFTFWYVFDIL